MSNAPKPLDGSLLQGPGGAFVRSAGVHRSTEVACEAGRYHLYIGLACPWAQGALAALHFKGLEDAVGFSVAHPTWRRTKPDDPDDEHCGWWFRAPGDAPVASELGFGANECDSACVPDTVNQCRTVRELYEKAGDTGFKYSTPLLWDKKEGTIVSNESMDILRIFDTALQPLAKNKQRLFPEDASHAASCEELNELIYPCVNDGVYRCGFAKTQSAYDVALEKLFGALDKLERGLASTSRFLTGNTFTWIDLRLYMTLVRFDPVYIVYFKTNTKRIEDYPHLLAFVRRCYQIDALKKTTNLTHIKMHYFTSHPRYNYYGIIPGYNGPALE